MSGTMRAFVNESPVLVPAGSPALAAVEAFDPTLADKVSAGGAYLTDGRGIRMEPGTTLSPGAILRVIASRTARDADA